MRQGRVRSAIVLAGALCACHAGPASHTVVRDSAGVRIVDNGAAVRALPWRLDGPVLSIGVVEGADAYEFTNIFSAFRLPDGRIAVANGRNPPEIRIFDESGRHVRSIGGEDAGPGEFRMVFFADLVGDTMRSYDPLTGRFSRSDSAGELLRVDPVADVDANAATRFILFPGVAAGTLLGRSNAPRSTSATPGRRPGVSSIVLTDAAGTTAAGSKSRARRGSFCSLRAPRPPFAIPWSTSARARISPSTCTASTSRCGGGSAAPSSRAP